MSSNSHSSASSSTEQEKIVTNSLPADEEQQETEQETKSSEPTQTQGQPEMKINVEIQPKDGLVSAPQEEEGPPLSENNMNMKQVHLFQPIFTPQDEITILKGLSDFWATGKTHKWRDFHKFITGALHDRFKDNQLSEKIRRLKAKFEEQCLSIAENGGRVDFPNSHDSLVYELSKNLWESDNVISAKTTKTKTKKANMKIDDSDGDELSKKISKKQKQVADETFDFDAEFPAYAALLNSFKCSFVKEQFGPSSRKTLENAEHECRRLNREECQLALDLINVRTKQAALVRSGIME